MNTQQVHDLIRETYTLSESQSIVARNLLCAVLEIVKCDGSSFKDTSSGYFWEKIELALKEIGYTIADIDDIYPDNQHCIISKQKN